MRPLQEAQLRDAKAMNKAWVLVLFGKKELQNVCMKWWKSCNLVDFEFDSTDDLDDKYSKLFQFGSVI